MSTTSIQPSNHPTIQHRNCIPLFLNNSSLVYAACVFPFHAHLRRLLWVSVSTNSKPLQSTGNPKLPPPKKRGTLGDFRMTAGSIFAEVTDIHLCSLHRDTVMQHTWDPSALQLQVFFPNCFSLVHAACVFFILSRHAHTHVKFTSLSTGLPA